MRESITKSTTKSMAKRVVLVALALMGVSLSAGAAEAARTSRRCFRPMSLFLYYGGHNISYNFNRIEEYTRRMDRYLECRERSIEAAARRVAQLEQRAAMLEHRLQKQVNRLEDKLEAQTKKAN